MWYAIGALLLMVVIQWFQISSLQKSEEKFENEFFRARKFFNENVSTANAHLTAFKELVELVGYKIEQKHDVEFDIGAMLRGERPKHEKKFIITKAEKPKPVRKIKVISRK